MTLDADYVDELLRTAVTFSRRHVEAGGLPFVGQIVTADGHVSDYGVNQVRETGDPAAHAEIVAMCAMLRARGTSALAGATLLATGEPCALCYRFASDHGVAEVAFAVDRDAAAACGFDYRDGYAALGTDRLPLAQSARHHLVPNALEPFTTFASHTRSSERI